MEPAFLAASFEVDGPHSCCEGHSLVTSPERPPRIWSGTADWYIRFWSTTSGNQLNHDKGSQVCFQLLWGMQSEDDHIYYTESNFDGSTFRYAIWHGVRM